MQQLSEAKRAGFLLAGYAGNSAPDHVDQLHALATFLKWTTRGLRSNPWLRSTLGGWEVAGVTSFQSGAPNTLNVAVDVARIGVATLRASLPSLPSFPPDTDSINELQGKLNLSGWVR